MSASEDQLLQIALDELDLPKVLATVARQCRTELGADRVRGLAPRTDAHQLRTELDRVQECVDLIAAGETIPFDHLDDVRPLLRKSRIEGNFLTAPDLLNVLEVMTASRQLRRFYDEQAVRAPYLHDLCQPLIDDRVLEKHITEAIDESGSVRDAASRELLSIRREIQALPRRTGPKRAR